MKFGKNRVNFGKFWQLRQFSSKTPTRITGGGWPAGRWPCEVPMERLGKPDVITLSTSSATVEARRKMARTCTADDRRFLISGQGAPLGWPPVGEGLGGGSKGGSRSVVGGNAAVGAIEVGKGRPIRACPMRRLRLVGNGSEVTMGWRPLR